jgi:hypothetical protein
VERALKLAVERYCSVGAVLLAGTSTITHRAVVVVTPADVIKATSSRMCRAASRS